MLAKRVLWAAPLAALLGLALIGAGHAAEGKGGGTATYVQVSSEALELPDGRSLIRAQSKGVIVADDASVPFHLATQDCSGTQILAEEQLVVENGYCDIIDKDGDVWWLWYHNGEDGNTWEAIGGTGKYQGMTGSGTSEVLAALPDGRLVVRWDGAWEMP